MSKILNFSPEAVSLPEGDNVRVKEDGIDSKTGKVRYVLTLDVWNPAKGRSESVRRVAIGERARTEKYLEIMQLAGAGSLKSVSFEKCVDAAVKENHGAGMDSTYRIIREKLGRYRVDRSFAFRYQKFIGDLRDKGFAENTISNYKSCIRHTLKKAWTDNLINEIPIRDFAIKHVFRSRIWSEDEKLRIYNQLDQDDNLFWMIHFAEKNPIRKMDLVNLKRENLVLVGFKAPYIRFQPSKTKRSCPKPCILDQLDQAMLERFSDLQKRFPNCEYLFPAIYKNKRKGIEYCEYQGNIQTKWDRIREQARVSDFHFHDLKHVAITHMKRLGISNEVLKKRGIQMTDKAVDIYDESDGLDTLGSIFPRYSDRVAQ